MADILAMHMGNELLSVPVAVASLVLAAAIIAVAGRMAKRTVDAQRLGLMGVMAAFVFAAQMINLPILPGMSGHLGGGALLAILLGPWAAVLSMASILIVQCLLFQDGGLLALGCNIVNMGVLPAFIGYYLYKWMLGRPDAAPAWRQYAAAYVAAVAGVVGGAALVPLQSAASGVLTIPTRDFLSVMAGVHLVIGLVEGLITFAVIAYLRKVRPAVLGLAQADVPAAGRARWAVGASIIITAVLLAGIGSRFASEHPDGLEWSYMEHKYAGAEQAVVNSSPAIASADALQAKLTPMPDYGARSSAIGILPVEASSEQEPASGHWTSLAGLVGTIATLILVYILAAMIKQRKAKVLPKCIMPT